MHTASLPCIHFCKMCTDSMFVSAKQCITSSCSHPFCVIHQRLYDSQCHLSHAGFLIVNSWWRSCWTS